MTALVIRKKRKNKMKDNPEYAVYEKGETFMSSLYKDIVTFSLLCFSIYISQGSTWWTFITGIMFLLFVFAKLSLAMKRYNRFKTKEELQAWVDKLD